MGNNAQMFASGTRFSEETAMHCLSVLKCEMFGKSITRYENLGGAKKIYGADGEELGTRVFFRDGNMTLVVWQRYGEDWTQPEFWFKYAGAEMFCTSSRDKDGNVIVNRKVLTMRSLNEDELAMMQDIVVEEPQTEEPQA